MSKKIIGIIAAIAVVVIIVLVGIEKPAAPAPEEVIDVEEIIVDSLVTDTTGVETDTLFID